ncbi:hypothetical protein Agub_g13837, partial [Astrephomene gubernaculifera]
ALHAPLPPGVRLVSRLDSRPLDPAALLDPGADFSATLRRLGAALQALGREAEGRSRMGEVPEPGLPLTALGPLGELLDDWQLEAVLARCLARSLGGPAGLSLLLLFARLHRVRPAAQLLVVLQALLAGGAWQPDSEEYLRALKRMWELAMMWHRAGRLTHAEGEGLAGVMATFLQRACPLLANHYTELPGKQSVPCLVLLVQMCGWALTWDPTRSPPMQPIREHMQRAAEAEAARTAALLPHPHPHPQQSQAGGGGEGGAGGGGGGA